MNNIVIDYGKKIGPIKPMNAVNNGPVRLHDDEQKRTNFETFKEIHIPYVRTHDSGYCEMYGNEHTIDVAAIFPDFNADVNAPESYDFTLTDDYLDAIITAGSQVFYRLGTKIEQWIKKYQTLPPKNFSKWAAICEHIILHYNEGWNNGFYYGITYWEIWNEPDMTPDEHPNKRTWGGTAKEFYSFYQIVSSYLKTCFPKLMIGGPACAGVQEEWIRDFLDYLVESSEKPVLDFFSWHYYGSEPDPIIDNAITVRKLLDSHGFFQTESILDEWNYVRDWTDNYVYSLLSIIGMKGAAFSAAFMCVGQRAPVDMMMYYDARPCEMNGMFDFYSLYPIKGYYPFVIFDNLIKLGLEYETRTNADNLYAIGAADEKGNYQILLCCYTDDDNQIMPEEISLELKNCPKERFKIYYIDMEHDLEQKNVINKSQDGKIQFVMSPNTVLWIKSVD